jgi:hypothetical protein
VGTKLRKKHPKIQNTSVHHFILGRADVSVAKGEAPKKKHENDIDIC